MAQIKIIIAALLFVAALTNVQSSLVEDRLLGSKDSERRSHIYHVAITKQRKFWFVPIGKEYFVGSGALLSNRWIVTSARVAKEADPGFFSSSNVKVGLDRLQSKPVQTLAIEKVVIHEFYTGKDTDNDIALIKVKEPGFILNEEVNVVSIASEPLPQDVQIVVTGWHAAGKEKKPLQELTVNIKDKQACGEALGDKDLVDQTLFCVENTADRAVCANDYGSPAVIARGDQNVLVGIFSMTKEPKKNELCGTSPAVFTDIQWYNGWIGNHIL